MVNATSPARHPPLRPAPPTSSSWGLLTLVNAAAAIRAPTLPAAADMPWKKERTSVGYTSPATSHVVQLGPNCKGKW